VKVSWSHRDGRAVIIVDGLLGGVAPIDPDLLRVQPADVDPTGVATAGHWSAVPGGACFTPRFPPMDGVAYTVTVHRSLWASDDDADEFTTHRIEAPAPARRAVTTVEAIYPSGGRLARNQLRLYLHFSRRMSEGFAAEHVTICDGHDGAVLSDVLLAMDPELWDLARQRLTLLFDPGRIKRGLVPHQQGGYPLSEGSTIQVKVDAGFLDASGLPLLGDHVATFKVGADQRGRVDPGRWGIEAPTLGTRQPLRVTFDRPLDHALLRRCITVGGVGGVIEVGWGEESWSFVPDEAWALPEVSLHIASILEDGAGNSVARVFDRDLANADDDPRSSAPTTIAVPLRLR
jgi:hypothetical protein